MFKGIGDFAAMLKQAGAMKGQFEEMQSRMAETQNHLAQMPSMRCYSSSKALTFILEKNLIISSRNSFCYAYEYELQKLFQISKLNQ